MKSTIIAHIEKFVERVMTGGEEVSPQETAVLPEILKILQQETTGKSDGQ